MKNLYKMIGIAALVAVIGLSMMACGDGGGGEPKSITITGISGLSGVVEVFIDDGNDRVIAGNKNGTISSGSVTVELFTSVDSDGSDFTTTAYTGSGSYYVWIGAGQNWYHTSQKISITEATTTIPFAQFTTM
ncbi:MAG: hypothetical protein LBQ93_10295 [Treponema sp.]|jgi:hypothetical protein|nr:hypothetical protein [Treponema sp.]